MSISNYSTSASLNTTISGIDIGENSPAASVNNAIRQLMADIKSQVGQFVPVTINGATGDGSTNDYATLSSALTDYTGRRVYANGAFKTLSVLSVGALTTIEGEGPATIFKTTVASNHIFSVNAADITLRNLAILGTNGTSVHNNSGIVLPANAVRARLLNISMSGMSGSAFWASGASYGRISGAYVHDLTGSFTNSSAVELFDTVTAFDVDHSLFDATSTTTEVGVLCQTTSTRHNVISCRFRGYTAYAIADYDNIPRSTYSRFINNEIANIDGSVPAASGGAGIYTVGTGGQIIALNTTTNCNISTLNDSLAPGGIGNAQAFSPIMTGLNFHHHNNWYGRSIMSTAQIVSSVGEAFFENVKDQLFVKASSHAHIVGASITALTVGTSVRCVSVNIGSSGAQQTGVSVIGVRSRGGGSAARGHEYQYTDQVVAVGSNHSDCAGQGGYFFSGAGANVIGNTYDVSSGSFIALTLNAMTNSVVDGKVLKTAGATALSTTGTCTGLRIGKNIAIYASGSWQAEPMNFIDNSGTGCIVEAYGSAAPTLLTHKIGDRVWNVAPALGSPDYWVCTVSGTPGTWEAKYLRKEYSGSATYDLASLADGAGATTTVTVTGAALGDMAFASLSVDLQGVTVTAWVSAANTVSVRFQNESGGVLDLASATLKAWVVRV